MTPYAHALNLYRRTTLYEPETAQAYTEERQKLLENLKSQKGKVIASRLSDPSYKIPPKVEGVVPIRELVRQPLKITLARTHLNCSWPS